MNDLTSTPSSMSSRSIGDSPFYKISPCTVITQSSPVDCCRQFRELDGLSCQESSSSPLSKTQRKSTVQEDETAWDTSKRGFNKRAERLQQCSAKLSPTAAPFTPRSSGSEPCRSNHALGQEIAKLDDDLTILDVCQVALTDPFSSHFNGTQLSETHNVENYNSLSHDKTDINSTAVDLRFWPGERKAAPLDGSSHRNQSHLECNFISRYIEISNVARDVVVEDLGSALNNMKFKPPTLVVITELATRGLVFLHFADIRDARIALTELQLCFPQWNIEFVDQAHFLNPQWAPQVNNKETSEARVVATAVYDGPKQMFHVHKIIQMMQDFLGAFGDLLNWTVISREFPRLAVQVDYYDIGAAQSALHAHFCKRPGLLILLNPPWRERAFRAESSLPKNEISTTTSRDTISYEGISQGFLADLHSSPGTRTASRSKLLSTYLHHLTPPFKEASQSHKHYNERQTTLIPYQRFDLGVSNYGNFNQLPRQQRGNASQWFRSSSDYLAGQHNVVDVARIRQGLDVRTTVMLRNIPNKITQGMLKEILDETSRGKYDFMYLRIDFANNCNVGYAFINFEDPWYIMDFVAFRAGRRWNRFNSDKVAEVSYATIQGKDCLIQKFRNSSVMMEHPSFRPKIFRTGCGPDGGEEEPFPGPDNPSKMRRSVENAEHVGLFAPRGAFHYRSEQRRRRSRYDRGTRFAEMEDASNSGMHLHHSTLDLNETC